MDLPHDWNEFFRLFNSSRVRYLVVGAHALAANGRPRATADLDILVEPTLKKARAVCAALAAFGFRTLAKEVEAFATPDRMATLGNPPLRIDVMTSISGVSFACARVRPFPKLESSEPSGMSRTTASDLTSPRRRTTGPRAGSSRGRCRCCN